MSSQPEQQPGHAEEHGAGETPDGIPNIGDVLAGKYRIERVLGVGGMGVVLAAMHLHLGERVALKFLLPTMATAETVERFAREARAAARIKSEHIAHVTDVAQLDSGATYMVMEFLEGKDLSEVLRDGEGLPIRDAVEYVIQACDAVAEAHSMGIVHRDLKPANLFLARRPGAPARIKVLDFGISKMTPPNQASDATPAYQQRAMTHTRAWLGSPLYMAPEQMKSAKGVDARTDIWSLGVILFELLTGTVPFAGSNLPELCAEILHGKPADVESRRPDVPRELGDVVRRCLTKDPAARYQNIAELVMALIEFAPRRARSVAERAVSLIEGAGLMSPASVPRAALDSTLADEGLMSPMRESAVPPASLRLDSPAIPRPPRTPSFAPTNAPQDVAEARTMVARPGELTANEQRRGGALVPILVVLTLVASVGLTLLWLSRRGNNGGAEPAPSASVSAGPLAAPATVAPSGSAQAPAATASASVSATAPSAEEAAAAPASATAAAPASAAVSAPPASSSSAAPHAASAAPTASAPRGAKPPPGRAPAAPPVVTPVHELPAPPGNGGDLRIETCHERLPDGTSRVIPCP